MRDTEMAEKMPKELKDYEALEEELPSIEGHPQGFSMRYGLNPISHIRHGVTYYPKAEFIARTYDNRVIRQTYAEWFERCVRISNALKDLGVEEHSFVQVYGDNTMEANEAKTAIWLADCIPEFMNPFFEYRFAAHGATLFKDQAVFVGAARLAQMEKAAPHMKSVKTFIVMPEIPEGGTSLKNAYSYSDLIGQSSSAFKGWPEPPEWGAGCVNWTTGTTGIPKPCLHCHRDIWIQSVYHCLRSDMGIGLGDSLLHVIGVYHAGHWMFDLSGMMYGNTQVLVGTGPDPDWLAKLIEVGGVTFSAGVPQVWERFLDYIDAEKKKGISHDISTLKRLNLAGTAPGMPLQKRLEERGIEPIHGWGMSEGPCWGAVQARPKPYYKLAADDVRKLRKRQGLPPPGLLEIKVLDSKGEEVPWNNSTPGELCQRGPIIISKYYKRPEENEKFFTGDGWFRTGDLAVVDPEGYVEIIDRSKDLIKSGGEWISSIMIENEAVAHPKVAIAACTWVPHPDWDERPVLLVVPSPGEQINEEEMLTFLAPRFRNWQLPDRVIVVEDVPRTSVGKINKAAIRQQYQNVRLPEEPVRKNPEIRRLCLD